MDSSLTPSAPSLWHAASAIAAQGLLLAVKTHVDVRDGTGRSSIVEAAPEVVIHAGAHTDVDGAERNPALALAVNAEGTERVARAAALVGARLIYISTDYVFDGRGTRPYVETDPTNPVSVYGESKRAGEQRALACCENTLVVRTAWLYGLHGRNFVKTILQLAAERPCLKIVADQRRCPTFAEDLAGMIGKLMVHPAQGVVHVTNEGHCTWHEFATEIVRLSGRPVPVEAISTADMPRPAKRPAYSVYSSSAHLHYGIKKKTGPHTYVWVEPTDYFDVSQLTKWGCSQ